MKNINLMVLLCTSVLLTHTGYATTTYQADQSLTLSSDPYGYDNEYQDSENKTVYLKARNLDTLSGEFVSQDTYGYFNRYLAFSGEPIAHIDPSGHSFIKKAFNKVAKVLKGTGESGASFVLSGVAMGMLGLGANGKIIKNAKGGPFGIDNLLGVNGHRVQMAWFKGLDPIAAFLPIINGDNSGKLLYNTYSFMSGVFAVGATYYMGKGMVGGYDPVAPSLEDDAGLGAKVRYPVARALDNITGASEDRLIAADKYEGLSGNLKFGERSLDSAASKMNPVSQFAEWGIKKVMGSSGYNEPLFGRAYFDEAGYRAADDGVDPDNYIKSYPPGDGAADVSSINLTERLANATQSGMVKFAIHAGSVIYNTISITGRMQAYSNMAVNYHYALSQPHQPGGGGGMPS